MREEKGVPLGGDEAAREMPTSSSAGRESRRSSKSGPSGSVAQGSGERKEKSKSSQSYATSYNAARRGSAQPSQEALGSVAERPRLKTRTHSEPLVEVRKTESGASGSELEDGLASPGPDAYTLAPQQVGGSGMANGQDEDEVAGAVGTVRQYQPFQSPEVRYLSCVAAHE